ncbi:MAG: hypothetical protein NTW87_23130 [Planctomycetota bacterium]|nr:hypothetical protein [Planctomycetota bacterium]
MTFEDLARCLEHYPACLAVALLLPPVTCLLLMLAHRKGAGAVSPWKYVYAVLIYWVCVPGLFAAVLTAYLLLFQNANLMKLNILVFFLPILSMGITLALIGRNAGSFDPIPGFNRLSGLMLMLVVSFAIAFVLHRLHIWVAFFGDLGSLLLIALIAFALLKLAAQRMAGAPQETPAEEHDPEP